MDKETALRVFEDLDSRFGWSEEEHEKGIKEAEEEGAEPLGRPHAFNVRLDSRGRTEDFVQDYRVRLTYGVYATSREDWRRVFDLAEEHDLSVEIQNNGIELS